MSIASEATETAEHAADAPPSEQPATRRYEWTESGPGTTGQTRYRALFIGVDGVLVLEHIRRVVIAQTVPSEGGLDAAATLEDLPTAVRASLPDDLEVSAGV